MRNKTDFKIASFVLALTLTMTSQALFAQYFQGPQVMSLAGSGRGGEHGLETAHLNPATIIHAPEGDAGIFYNFGRRPESGTKQKTLAVVALENNKDTFFSGYLAYIKNTLDFEDRPSIYEESWQAYGAKKLFKDWSFGVGVHHMRQNDYKFGIDSFFQASMGIHYKFSKYLGVGLSYLNFLNSYDPSAASILPELGGGVTYFYKDMLRLQVDLVKITRNNPKNKLQYAFGVESFLSDYMSLRLGYKINDLLHKTSLHTGIGLNGPRLQLHYSYSQDPKSNKNAMHGVDLRVPFW